MKRKIHAVWTGDGANGSGLLSSQSGAFENMPYSFKTRFENEDGKLGTNPEELIAAALAGCFNMKLSFVLNESNFSPEKNIYRRHTII
jgi:osmotically inducible protein OsmC